MRPWMGVETSGYGLPRRAEGLEVQPFSSSSRKDTFLVWLPSGRVLEVSKALADMLVLMDGHKSVAEIAEILSAAGPTRIAAAEVEEAIGRCLVPAGLVLLCPGGPAKTDGGDEEGTLGTRGVEVLSAKLLAPLTLRLQVLFAAPVRVPLLILACLCTWVLLGEGVGADRGAKTFRLSGQEAVGLYGLLLVSVLFHELGHLSALRFHGGEHGEVRMGLYLVFPVLYANVTKAWGLSRRARVDVDLGGVYFQFLLTIPCLAAYWISSSPVWTSLCAGILSMVALSMNPFFRFDGYWLCSDMLGVPNLRERSRRYLRQVWLRLRRGRPTGSPRDYDLGRVEAAGLFLYGIFSQAFFVAAGLLFCRFVLLRPDQFVAILGQGPVRVFEAVRNGDVWQGIALLPPTAVGYAAAYGMLRLSWQGVRACLRAARSAWSKGRARRTSVWRRKGGFSGFRQKIVFSLAVLLLAWGVSACGESGSGLSPSASEEEEPQAQPDRERVACGDLERNQERATGGTFACLLCMRSWQWEIPAGSGGLVVFVAYNVEEASEEVLLRFVRSDRSVFWERRVLSGEQGSVCLTDDDPQEGPYELSLSGDDGPLGLLRSFRGSIRAAVASEQRGFLDSRSRSFNGTVQETIWKGAFPE